jgi:two-component system KDP operon response regulator KdpE
MPPGQTSTPSPRNSDQNLDNLSHHILLVDDDEMLLNMVRMHLERRGMRVTLAHDGQEALSVLNKTLPDLILLDLMMPKVDGLQVCRAVRANSTVPIIVLSAIGYEEKKVEALQLGADDYITKPFGLNELMARILAVTRRSLRFRTPLESIKRIGELYIDLESGAAALNGESLYLTPTEFKLLVEFIKHPQEILTHKKLLKRVWGSTYTESTEYLHMYISRLRKKLRTLETMEIKTHTGVGYSFEPRRE